MITYRAEKPGEEQAIFAVIDAAFTDHPHSEGMEPQIVDQLRRDGHLILSLVAEEAGEIIGQASYSPAWLSDGTPGWMTLGPIAVLPAKQGEGIGRKLLEEGARLLEARGAEGIILLGDISLYSRFGYIQNTPITLEGGLAPYLQVLPFTEDIPTATVDFAPAFSLARMKDL